jgi:hypothetical protein
MDAAWAANAHANLELSRAPRADAMSELAQRTGDKCVRHVRDPDFYRWRFRNPLCDYRYVYWHESRLEAFAVLQLWRDGNGADVRIVDWEASRPEVFHSMLRRIAERGGSDVLSIWTAALEAEGRSTLANLAFRERDETRDGTTFRPGLMAIGADTDTIRESGLETHQLFSCLDRWALRMAHSDAY